MLKSMTRLAAALVIAGTTVQAETWNIDASHSSVGFSVKHLMVSKVRGNFKDFSGSLEWDGKNLAGGSVQFEAKSASITTDNEKRDGHLKSPDFFAVDSFPTLTFKSTKVTPGEGDTFKLTGDLTLRGVTKEVTFDCTFNGTQQTPWGFTAAAFSATTTINRQDFKVSWSKALDGGGLVVSDDVKIEIELEVNNAKMEK
jgi:polyisoprenoid-binding protein YceI